jgi:hypothetical protein
MKGIDFNIKMLAIQLLRSRQSDNLLSTIRAQLTPSLYSRFISELKKYPEEKIPIISQSTSKQLIGIDTFFDMSPISIVDEIKWARAVLIQNLGFLRSFVHLSNQFSIFLMRGDILLAKNCLNEIESTYGHSLWLIKTKIAFLQLTEGLEAQKKYVQHVKEASVSRGWIAFISHWVSVRNEGTVTPNRYERQVENLIKTEIEPFNKFYAPYLKYHLLGQDDISLNDAVNVLRLDFSRSLIDFYESYIFFLRNLLLSDSKDLKLQIGYNLKKFVPQLDDPRIEFLIGLSNNNVSKTPFSNEGTVIIELILKGLYQEARERGKVLLKTHPTNPAIILAIALATSLNQQFDTDNDVESLATLDIDNKRIEVPLNEYILQKISKVFQIGVGRAINEVNDLIKISINLPSTLVDVATSIILKTEGFDEYTAVTPAMKILKLPYINPFFLPELEAPTLVSIYGQACEHYDATGFGTRYALGLAGIINFDDESLISDANNLLKAELAYRKTKFDTAAQYGKLLTWSGHPFYRRRGYKIVSHSLLMIDSIVECCSFVANHYVHDEFLYNVFPLKELTHNLKSENHWWKNVKHSLALSIVLDAYTKHIDTGLESQRAYAYEDFLDSAGIKRPSQIGAKLNDYNKREVIYFLRNICIQSIMDMSIEFESSSDVAAERLAVCKLLAEINPENLEEYQQEMKDLIRQDVIGKRLKEIDKSRIYVDIPKVTEWAKIELQEGFLRYLAYIKHGLDPESLAVHEEAKIRAAKLDVKGLLEMTVPDNEVTALFRHLVIELRDAYASNPEFGLDRFLSTRIRHGVIESQLRRPLDTYNLITQREGEYGPYKPNIYWKEQLNLIGQDDEKLEQHLSQFTSSYDNLIRSIKNQWLQITVKKDDAGLFNFLITDGEITYLASQITKESTIKEFIEIVVTHLNERLAGNLKVIRTSLINDAKRRAVELMNQLQVKVGSFEYSWILNDLQTAINFARTEIQGVFDRVAEWFTSSQSVGSTPYNVLDAISVAEQIIKDGNPLFSTIVKVESNTEFIIHGGLATFVDIMINIFDNVIKRSGLEIPVANIIVDKAEINSYIYMTIKVKNALGEEINRDSLSEDLLKRKQHLRLKSYGKSISKEGGSGFFKIDRSLKDFKTVGVDADPRMDFGIEDDSHFFISLSLPMITGDAYDLT